MLKLVFHFNALYVNIPFFELVRLASGNAGHSTSSQGCSQKHENDRNRHLASLKVPNDHSLTGKIWSHAVWRNEEMVTSLQVSKYASYIMISWTMCVRERESVSQKLTGI